MAKRKGDGAGGGDDSTDGKSGTPATRPYVVLARKYRPENFDALIGQGAMVQTLKNAFAADRIAQGYMLTGVRGVGKTTTARILARALNYSKPGLPDRPTVEMPDYGVHCPDIIASRHPDVIEMDAASNTGVDNIRELIESARYKPLVARYKVFIIDEVHMLSKGAFNALLKTLEEPPPHVKFIFATTEVRKVPVTVLSRCQRFDLRRVDVPELARHFHGIVSKEGATAEPDALAMIARAAEGSVRDGLSILDQAIAMGSGAVTLDTVRAMLGLTDRGRIFDLVELALKGAAADALALMTKLYGDGADPAQLLADLAEAVHVAMRIKIAGADAAGEALSAEERRRGMALADRLSVPLLSRAWQMLVKGIEDTGKAPNQRAAAEMVMIRIAYTADLPSPDEVIRILGGGAAPQRAPAGETPHPAGTPRAPLNVAPERAPANVAPERAPLNVVPAPPPQARTAPSPAAPTEADRPPWEDIEPDDRFEGLEADSEDPTPRFVPANPRSFAEVVALAGTKRDALLKRNLEDTVRLVRFEPGRIELNPLPGAPVQLANELADKLGRWTGRRWVIALSREPGERPLGEIRREREAAELAEIRAHPAVQAIFERFPGAEIKEIRSLGLPADTESSDGEDEGSAAG